MVLPVFYQKYCQDTFLLQPGVHHNVKENKKGKKCRLSFHQVLGTDELLVDEQKLFTFTFHHGHARG